MKLKDFAGELKLSGGQLVRRFFARDNEGGEILGSMGILMSKCISNGSVDLSFVEHDNYIKEIPEEMLTCEGDLIMKLSAPYDACIIDSKSAGLFIPNFFAVIRTDDLNAKYLMAFFATELFSQQVAADAAGSLTHLIRIGNLAKVDVPDKTDEEKKRIVDGYLRALAIKRKSEEIWKWELMRNDAMFLEDK